MELFAVSLVLFSAFLHAFWNILVKKGVDKLSFMFYAMIFSRVILAPYFLFILLRDGIQGFEIMPFFFAFLFHLLYLVYLSKTYTVGDISLTYPVIRSYPLFAVLPAFLILGESVSASALFGMLLMVFGVFMIHLDSFSSGDILGIFKNMRSKAFLFAVLTAFCSVGYSIFDKVSIMKLDPFVFFYLLGVPQALVLAFYLLRRDGGRSMVLGFKSQWRMSCLAGFLMFSSYLIILNAFQGEKIAYILSLRQSSIVFGVILGGSILREKHLIPRILSSLLIFFGAFILSISP